MQHVRRQKDLRIEETEFLAKLGVRREKRQAKEVNAASRIQRLVRGWLLRQWVAQHLNKSKLQRKMKRSYHVISKQIRLKMELAENAKRVEEIRERAAISTQSVCRMFLATKVLRKERFVRHVERMNTAATAMSTFVRKSLSKRCRLNLGDRLVAERTLRAAVCIQSIFRMWYLGKRVVTARRARRHREASATVQRGWRCALARRIRAMETMRKHSNTVARAAITIQGMVRGVLSRSNFEKIHSDHEKLLREAGALSIQRVLRGWLLGRARVRFVRWCRRRSEQTWSSVNIQRIARGMLARRHVGGLRQERTTDIFYQARVGNRQLVEDLHSVQDCRERFDVNGDSVFTIACRNGHKKLARKSLNKWGLDINHKNDFGQSGVMLAVRNGHGDLAEYLVGKRAEVSKFGRTLLHDACFMGLEGVVMALLVRDLDANAPDSSDANRAPLHKAVMGGPGGVSTATSPSMPDSARSASGTKALIQAASRLEIIRLLVKSGHAHVNGCDDDGLTALHIAASRGLDDCVAFLVAAGASVALEDNSGKTAWRYALLNDFEVCADLLKDGWQADTDDAKNNAVDPQEMLRLVEKPDSLINLVADKGDKIVLKTRGAIEAGFPIDHQDAENGRSLLMVAAEANAVETMRLCLDTISLTDKQAKSAAHFAAKHDAALTLLLEKVPNPEAFLQVHDSEGATPLHVVVSDGMVFEALFRLLKRSPEIVLDSVVDHVGNTPLHIAAHDANEAAVASLLDLGATCVGNKQGDTPLHLLATNLEVDSVSAVTCAQLSGAAAGVVNKAQQLPLHTAAANGCSVLLGLLLAHDPEMATAVDANGDSPFHLAVRSGHTECLKVLFDRATASAGCDNKLCMSLLVICARCSDDRDADFKAVLEAMDLEDADLEEVLNLGIDGGKAGVVRMVLAAQPSALSSLDQVTEVVELGHDDVLKEILEFWEQENAFPFQIDRNALALKAALSDRADNPKVLAQLVDQSSSPALRQRLVQGVCEAGNLECFKMLVSLDRKALEDPLEEDLNRTPLHVASLNGHVDIVRWLVVDNSVDQTAEDEDGATALMLAKEEVLEFFVDAEDLGAV